MTGQPAISTTDTYFAEIYADSMILLTDGRVLAPVMWRNVSGQAPANPPPLTALAFVQVDGTWLLDDWILGTWIFGQLYPGGMVPGSTPTS